MAKVAKRSFAVLLCVIIAVASFIGCFSVNAASDVLFKDEFTASAPTGWASSSVGSVSDGSYKISGTAMNTIAGQKFTAGLGIVANLSVSRATDSSTGQPYTSGTASVVFNISEDGKSYYEFGLGVRQNGSAYLLAYLNKADGSSIIIKKQSVNINGVADGKIRENVVYELKILALEGGKLQFVINNQLFAEANDVLKSGSVGVAAWNATASVEDIRVQKLGEKKVESIQVLNVPTNPVLVGEKLGIKVQANYSGIYGSQIIEDEAVGLKVTGYPTKVGTATLTATYGGKSADFTVNFNGIAKEEAVYTADFSKAEGWTLGKASAWPTFAWQIKGGKLSLPYPNVNGCDTALKAVAQAANAPDLKNINYFRVDASATITNSNETPDAGRIASIDIYINSDHSVRVSEGGSVTLFKGTTSLTQGKAAGIEVGKKFTVSIDVYGNAWGIDVNGVRAISYTHTELIAPAAKVQAVNGGVDVHSYKLTKTVQKSAWYAKGVTLVDGNGTPVKKVASRRLNLADLFLLATYGDGSTRKLAVTEDMLSGYDANATKTQTVTVTFGNFVKTFTHEYNSYLFQDSFDKDYKVNWSFTHPEYATWSVKNGQLEVNYYKKDRMSSRATIASCNGIKGANIAVGAQFMITETVGTTYAGLQFRKTGGNMYEYRLMYNEKNANFTAQLLRFNNNANVTLVTIGHKALLEAMEQEYFQVNDVFTLRAEAIGKDIYMFINDKLLSVYSDTDEKAVLDEGICTIKTVNASAWVDNFYIEEMKSRAPVGVHIIGAEDGIFEMYKGFELDPAQYEILVKFSDGFEVKLPLRDEHLSQLSGFADGDNKVTLTYGNYKTNITVRVSERPEYVKAFTDKLDKIDLSKLQESDKAAVYEIKDYFDTLSPWEVQNLDPAQYKKYCDMVVAMDRIITPQIADKELMYYNDFSTQINEDEWDFEYEGKAGTWDTRNGYIINEQNKYGVIGNGWARLKNVYGEINMIEVDMAMVYPSTYTAITWNLTEDGEYYHCRVTNKLADESGRAVYAVQLYRYTGAHQRLDQTYTDIHEIAMAEGAFNSMRVIFIDGVITVYVDDIAIFAYNDAASSKALYEGGVAFKSSENDSMYDNIRVYGTPKERPVEVPKQITPTVYEDNFDDETAGKSPSHWQEEYKADESTHVDAWKVYSKGGSNVYGTTGGKTSYTVLHAFESDPEITTKFMYTGSGKVGVLTRYYEQNTTTDADAFTAIGYDTASKKWFVAATESTLQEELQLIWAEEATPLAAGEMHDLQVVLSGATLKVVVDGKEVLATDTLKTFAVGKMGFFAQSAAMYIDDLKIVSKLGTLFQEGVDQFTFFYTGDGGTNSETEFLNENTMVAINGDNYISYDKGYTWQSWSDSKEGFAKVPKGGAIGYASIQDYGNGKHISVQDGDMSIWLSQDGMKSWKKISNVLPEEELFDVYGNRCAIIHVGSLTVVTLKDGTKRTFLPIAWRRYAANGTSLGHYVRFFYSDDQGYTWKESENDSRDVLLGYDDNVSSTVAEGKIIGCADGAVRYYQTRNGYGSIIYFESTDGGVNWTEFGIIPYMQSPMGSFGIAEDPEAPGTWYMAWQNTWPVTMGSIYPRIRISLARTTDGKNWEFMADIERTSTYGNDQHTHVRQFLDPDVTVTDEYVYVTHGRSDTGEQGSSHNNQVPRYTRFKKDKLTAHAWDDATIWDSNKAESIEITTLPQTKFGYADLFNTLGGIVTEHNLNGTSTQVQFREYAILEQPNMYKLGKQTVQIYSSTLHTASYEIEVVPNYDLIWTIKGKGTIDPDPDGMLRMMEGASQTFTLKPAKGYKVGSVTVNGKKVKVSKKTFTISSVQENQEITVVFAKLTIMDYLIWIILGAVVVAGAAVGVIFLIKKKKPKADGDKMEDISSNSTPPADRN